MTYQTRIGDDGRLEVSSEALAAAGFTPGDLVTIEQSRRELPVRAGDGDGALSRLRSAMRGYTVEHFLAERRADWGE